MKYIKYILLFLLILLHGCGDSSEPDVSVVEYDVDGNLCLVSDNSEDFIPYSNGNYMSKTLLWNCADYGIFSDHHIELFFTSDDSGQCYRFQRAWISAGICDKRATAPENPIFNMEIVSFDVTPYITASASGWDVTSSFRNSGNTTLFLSGPSYSENGIQKVSRSLEMYVGLSLIDTAEQHYIPSVSGSFDIKMDLVLWDGTILDSQTKTINLP